MALNTRRVRLGGIDSFTPDTGGGTTARQFQMSQLPRSIGGRFVYLEAIVLELYLTMTQGSSGTALVWENLLRVLKQVELSTLNFGTLLKPGLSGAELGMICAPFANGYSQRGPLGAVSMAAVTTSTASRTGRIFVRIPVGEDKRGLEQSEYGLPVVGFDPSDVLQLTFGDSTCLATDSTGAVFAGCSGTAWGIVSVDDSLWVPSVRHLLYETQATTDLTYGPYADQLITDAVFESDLNGLASGNGFDNILTFEIPGEVPSDAGYMHVNEFLRQVESPYFTWSTRAWPYQTAGSPSSGDPKTTTLALMPFRYRPKANARLTENPTGGLRVITTQTTLTTTRAVIQTVTPMNETLGNVLAELARVSGGLTPVVRTSGATMLRVGA